MPMSAFRLILPWSLPPATPRSAEHCADQAALHPTAAGRKRRWLPSAMTAASARGIAPRRAGGERRGRAAATPARTPRARLGAAALAQCCLALGAAMLCAPRAVPAAVITPTQAFASTYFESLQAPVNLINNSGLNTASGDVSTYTHARDSSAAGMWAAGQGQGIAGAAPPVASQYVVFDLGANYDLSSVYLWQMHQTSLPGRGIREFELYASATAPSAADAANPPATYDLTGFTQILATSTLAQASGLTTPTQTFALSGATNVRQVYLKIDSAWSGAANEIVGLSEIKFESAPIAATTFTWSNVAGGSWQTGSNWTPAGPPTVVDTAVFALDDAYTVTCEANATVDTLQVADGALTLSLGATALQTDTVDLGGGTLSIPALVSGSAAAGQAGYASALNFTDGTLEITGGVFRPTVGTLTSTTPSPPTTLTIANAWAISGVPGAPALPTLRLINGANASNTGGSIVFGLNGGRSALAVRDPDTSLTLIMPVTGNTMYFGLGGTVIASTFHPSEASVTASHEGLISSSGNLAVGTDGATGTVAVDDATMRTVSGNLIVGWRRYSATTGQESHGAITVTGGGMVHSGSSAYVGSRGGAGVVSVDGEGSSFAGAVGLYVGWERYQTTTGPSANGTLTLTNQASATGGAINIGTQGGIGVVNVDSGATLAATTGTLAVGNNLVGSNLAGRGTLTVSGGGVVSSLLGTYIGAHNGGEGGATITGAGSLLTSSEIIEIGASGVGTLAIADGGTVESTGSIFVGRTFAGTFTTDGHVSIDGAGSSLNAGSDLVIGHSSDGHGTLTLANGGQAGSAGEIQVGAYGGEGSVTVGLEDGADSAPARITAPRMIVGIGGSNGAILTVHPKGIVEVDGMLGAFPMPAPPASAIKIHLTGGLIKTDRTDFLNVAYLNWTSGTLWYTSGVNAGLPHSWVGADENATLTVPVGGLLKGSTHLEGRIAVRGTFAPGDDDSTATFNSRNLSIGAAGIQGTLAADVDFATASADLLNVTGTVTLTNARLTLSVHNAPVTLPEPVTFLLIANDASDAVVGTFAAVDAGPGAPPYSIDYAFTGTAVNGTGTGNDVAITFHASMPEPTDTHTPPQATATATPTATATATNTSTATATTPDTATPTATATASDTATVTPSHTATATATASHTATPTATATDSDTPTATPSHTATATATASHSSTPTATATDSDTPTATPSNTATATATASHSSTPTATATDSDTPTATPSNTATPTATSPDTPTVTPAETATPLHTATATATPGDPSDDTDGDGVPDAVENLAPHGGDGNGDGIPDRVQSDVASLPSAGGAGYVTVVAGDTACGPLADVQALPGPAVGSDPGYAYPFGLIGFRIQCPPGGTAAVRVLFHDAAAQVTGLEYRKHGPVPPAFGAPQFYSLPGVAFSVEPVGGTGGSALTARFDLTDGQLGDGTPVDGVILDPGGPARRRTTPAPAATPIALLAMALTVCAIGGWSLVRVRRLGRVSR